MRLIAILLALAALAGCDRQKAETPQGAGPEAGAAAAGEPTGRLDRSHAGTEAPDIAFEDPDGEPVTLADFRGRPLLVNFWATWCAPCIVEMPELEELARREQGGLQVLPLSQDIEGRDKVERFLAERRFAMLEAYMDPQLAVMGAMGITNLPTTILFDAEGREVWRMVGIEDWTGERAAELIAEAEGS